MGVVLIVILIIMLLVIFVAVIAPDEMGKLRITAEEEQKAKEMMQTRFYKELKKEL